MGFFSDLKQDLSQAVNELVPEEDTTNISFRQAEEEGITLEEMIGRIDNIVPQEDAETDENQGEMEFQTEQTELEVGIEEVLKQMEEETEAIEIAGEDANGAEGLDEMSPAEALEEDDTPDVDEIARALEASVTEEPQEEPEKTNKGESKLMDSIVGKIISDETALITAGMTVNGDISSEGSLDVIGTINGNIEVLGKLNITGHVLGDSKASEIYADGAQICGEVISEGAVKVGASTVILGNITASSAAIAGAVKGDIDVNGPVVLDASAIVMGNIKSKSVQINNGAVIEGMCSQCYADVNPTSFFDEYKVPEKKSKQKGQPKE